MKNISKSIRSVLIPVVVAAVAFGMPSGLNAQSTHMTSTNLALGGGGTAYVDSYHANFVNPANLMLNEGRKPRFSLGLMGGLSTNVGGSLINLNVYNEYFTKGLTISGDVAEEVLSKWFGSSSSDMRNVGMQIDIVPVGTAYRSDKWAMSAALRSRILLSGGVSRGMAELGIYGLDGEVFADGRAVNFNMEVLGFYEASIGYSRRLLSIPNLFGFARNVKVYAGIAPKLLVGAHNSKMNFNSTLQIQGESQNEIDLIRHQFTYSFETTGSLADQLNNYYQDRQSMSEPPDLGGYIEEPDHTDFYDIKASGWGFDLGGTIEMDIDVPFIGAAFRGPEKLRVGLSLTDIGQVSFTEKVGRFAADDVLEWEGFDLDQEKIDNEFNGDREAYLESVLTDSIATEIYGSFAPQQIDRITRALPSMVNFGAQLIMRKLSLSVDLSKGFVEQGTNSKRFAFSTGIEYKLLGFMPFRAGMRTGGLSSTAYSAGWGLEFKNFDFSFAASTVPKSLNYGSSAGVAWSGFLFRF